MEGQVEHAYWTWCVLFRRPCRGRQIHPGAKLRVEGIEPSGYKTLLDPSRREKLRGYGTGATVPQTATGGLG